MKLDATGKSLRLATQRFELQPRRIELIHYLALCNGRLGECAKEHPSFTASTMIGEWDTYRNTFRT